jgi:hypothetical protein
MASFIGLHVLAMLVDEHDDGDRHSMIEPLIEMIWRGLGKRGDTQGAT